MLVGILLFLVFDEQSTPGAPRETTDRRYTVVLGAGLLAFLGLLLSTVHRVSGPAVIYHFFLPLAAVAALLIAHDPRTGPLADRFRKISRSWFPVLAGLAIPVVLFLYLATWQVPRGFTALTVLITFLSGVNLVFLGIIGEYVGRIYEEVKARPICVVSELISSALQVARAAGQSS